MNSNTNLIVDLQRPNIATVVYGVQGDSLSRTLTLSMIDGDKPWTPPEGALPVVRYGKPDGTFGFYDTLENGAPAISVTGSTATVTLAAQALTAPGSVAMQLNFYTAAAEKLSTFCWILKVDPAAVEDGKLESTDYISALTEAMARAIELLPEIAKAGEYAESAGKSASDAKKSAEAAGTSAGSASTAALDAGESANNAANAANRADTAARAAGQSAGAASGSASSAAGSAAAAEKSAKSAADSEQEAEAWAVGQRGGADVPSDDPTHNNNAKYYAEQARSAAGGGVLSVNGNQPDAAGNVQLTAGDVGALPKDGTASKAEKLTDTLPIAGGGTGATTAAAALSNLGAMPKDGLIVQAFAGTLGPGVAVTTIPLTTPPGYTYVSVLSTEPMGWMGPLILAASQSSAQSAQVWGVAHDNTGGQVYVHVLYRKS